LQEILKKCAATRLPSALPGIALACAVGLIGCKPASEADSQPPTINAATAELCGRNGRLRTELYGALSVPLNWHSADLECSGMPRPDGAGVRLRFAGFAGSDDRRIAIIIAIPALQRDVAGSELHSNVTIIEEGGGRFFSTPDLDNCFTDISSFDAIDGTMDQYSIGGVLYCPSPLPEVNGDSSVSIPKLEFTGLINWSAP
jgi:hypothetical protein